MKIEIYNDVLIKKDGDLSLRVHHNHKKIKRIIIFKDEKQVYFSGFLERRKANKIVKSNDTDKLKDYWNFILNRYKLGM